MEHLFDRLAEYGQGDMYPCHMPGHKRRRWGSLPEDMCRMDITEIEGFDNLHQPEALLRELQEHAAALYGAEESFYLINGSTSGILSAVSAALPERGHILMARNCHKSAYHAAYLRNLNISYLYPPLMKEYDIFDGISSGQVEEALEKNPDIGAVLIVSPTYEGRISDIERIAETVHARNIPFIVDEAHGAHLGFTKDFAENSCRMGADIVIHSVHKTLPALTQTALLHVNGERVDRMLLRRFLHIYQSSSPSYLLMASIDNALRYVEETGAAAFAAFAANYRKLLADLSACKCLRFLPLETGRQDIGKLLISTKMTNMSGKSLYDILLKEYHLQLEMAAETYALAMFTVNDTEEGYERVKSALLQVDVTLRPAVDGMYSAGADAVIDGEHFAKADIAVSEKHCEETKVAVEIEQPAERKYAADPTYFAEAVSDGVIPFARAWDMEKRFVELQESMDCFAGDFVNLYPPGIPLLVPGERITSRLLADIHHYLNKGLNVQGLEAGAHGMRISVLTM